MGNFMLPWVVLTQKTALKSIPNMGYIPAMWFTNKFCNFKHIMYSSRALDLDI